MMRTRCQHKQTPHCRALIYTPRYSRGEQLSASVIHHHLVHAALVFSSTAAACDKATWKSPEVMMMGRLAHVLSFVSFFSLSFFCNSYLHNSNNHAVSFIYLKYLYFSLFLTYVVCHKNKHTWIYLPLRRHHHHHHHVTESPPSPVQFFFFPIYCLLSCLPSIVPPPFFCHIPNYPHKTCGLGDIDVCWKGAVGLLLLKEPLKAPFLTPYFIEKKTCIYLPLLLPFNRSLFLLFYQVFYMGRLIWFFIFFAIFLVFGFFFLVPCPNIFPHHVS